MGQVLVCGVCGGTGAGKTTLVNDLVARWSGDVALVAFDSYYHDLSHLEPTERAAVNYDHPDSLDVDLFVAHLDELRSGGVIEVPEYDFATHTRPGPTRRVEATSLVLVDGILLLAFESIRERLDHAVFLDVATDLRFERRLRRDTRERGRSPASVHSQWTTTVDPMHRSFVGPSAAHADIVVDRFDEVTRAAVVERVLTGIQRRVSSLHGV